MGFKWERLAQIWMQKFHGLLGFEGSALVQALYLKEQMSEWWRVHRERRGKRLGKQNFGPHFLVDEISTDSTDPIPGQRNLR